MAGLKRVFFDTSVLLTENRRDFLSLLRHGLPVLSAAQMVDEAGL